MALLAHPSRAMLPTRTCIRIPPTHLQHQQGQLPEAGVACLLRTALGDHQSLRDVEAGQQAALTRQPALWPILLHNECSIGDTHDH